MGKYRQDDDDDDDEDNDDGLEIIPAIYFFHAAKISFLNRFLMMTISWINHKLWSPHRQSMYCVYVKWVLPDASD